ADDRFMHEIVSRLEPAFGMKLGHPRRGARAAGRAVDRLGAIEDGVARMGLRVPRGTGPQNMRKSTDSVVDRMHETVRLVQALPQDRAPADQVSRRMVRHVAIVLLRLDDGV